MRAVYGASLFDFFPRTYILPNDYPKLIDQYIENDRWTSYIRQRMSRSAKYSAKTRSESTTINSRTGSASSQASRKTDKSFTTKKYPETLAKSEAIAKESRKSRYTWIAKPAENSQGRGITILNDLADLRFETATVVQKYIDNPMMISGYKFDLRLYVIVASYNPLTVYLYKVSI